MILILCRRRAGSNLSTLDKTFGEELKGDWKGGGNNPEKSENNRAGSSDNIIAIDASGLREFASKVGLDDEPSPLVKAGA